MGHLGWADRPADPLNARGRDRFVRAVDQARAAGLRPAVRHLSATAATVADPAGHFDLCRVGAGLVGIDPSGTTRLCGAMTMTAPVISVRDVPAGAHVGYGRSYRTSAPTRLALVPVGYADGVPRAAEGRAEVLVAGRPLRGSAADTISTHTGSAPPRHGRPGRPGRCCGAVW
jgi:alanine racemase